MSDQMGHSSFWFIGMLGRSLLMCLTYTFTISISSRVQCNSFFHQPHFNWCQSSFIQWFTKYLLLKCRLPSLLNNDITKKNANIQQGRFQFTRKWLIRYIMWKLPERKMINVTGLDITGRKFYVTWTNEQKRNYIKHVNVSSNSYFYILIQMKWYGWNINIQNIVGGPKFTLPSIPPWNNFFNLKLK